MLYAGCGLWSITRFPPPDTWDLTPSSKHPTLRHSPLPIAAAHQNSRFRLRLRFSRPSACKIFLNLNLDLNATKFDSRTVIWHIRFMIANNPYPHNRALLTYILISIVIYLECYITSFSMRMGEYAYPIYFYSILQLLSMPLIFCAVFGFLAFRNGNMYLRHSLSKKPLLVHILFFFTVISASALLLFLDNIFPEKFTLLINGIRNISVWFALFMVLSCAVYHFTLTKTLFKIKNLPGRYIPSLLFTSIFTFVSPRYVFSALQLHKKIWPFLSDIVAYSVLWLMRSFGIKKTLVAYSAISHPGDTEIIRRPVIYTGEFAAQIGISCSGFLGMSLFLASIAGIFFLDAKRIKPHKILLLIPAGIIYMFCLNILRVFLIMLTGHFVSPDLATGLIHSFAGVFIYFIAIILFFLVTYKWMLNKEG
ncbi:MAG: hypothetical protein GF408_07255 [Candidatus Omnitrophica bacterium]|nr:hypothetical protein [Candidatus Omnitrophota bacterium]